MLDKNKACIKVSGPALALGVWQCARYCFLMNYTASTIPDPRAMNTGLFQQGESITFDNFLDNISRVKLSGSATLVHSLFCNGGL